MTSIEYNLINGTMVADVKQDCPICTMRSHVIIRGKKNVEAVQNYFWDSLAKQQDLPFEIPIREFLRSGYCRSCMDNYFGTSSADIRYVRRTKKGEII